MNGKMDDHTKEELEKLHAAMGNGGDGHEGPEEINLDEMAVTPEEAANALIAYANEEFSSLGLKPMSVLQRLLLRASIIGFAKKHDIEKFDLKTYPELGLALSALWISTTKWREYKAKHGKKPAPAPKPPQEQPAAPATQ